MSAGLECILSLTFGKGGNETNHLGSGWSGDEPESRWMIGQGSEIWLEHPGQGHDLIIDAAKHAYFDARSGEIKLKLSRIGSVANCVVLDNGSRPVRDVAGRELLISNALAKELGGRIEHGYAAEFTSVVLSFHLSERERQASWSMATRRMRSPRSLKLRSSATAGLNSGLSDQIEPSAAMRTDPNSSSARPNEPDSSSRGPDVLGNLLSPSHRMDAL